MKILFVYPDFKVNIDPQTGRFTGVERGGWYMEGVGSLSALLKQAGHEVDLYHLTQPVERPEYQAALKRYAPDLIGFVTMTREYPQVKEYALWTKDVLDVPTISGSYHPTTMPEEVLGTEGIDMLCRGEADQALIELVTRMDVGEDYRDVKNIWLKQGGETYRNEVRPTMPDIDELPLPDFELFDFSNILATQIKTAIVILSRGCPYSCTYCSNKKMRDIYPEKSKYSRFHSPEYSIEYLKKLRSVYPEMRYLNFRDDILPWKGGWLARFTELYKKEIGLPFICNYRANLINPEIAKMLREAGCYQMFFGVESGNEYIRNEVLNRHMSTQQIKDAFAACREQGIKTVAYNMVGIPFEDKARVLDTIKLNVDIRADISLNPIYYPYPDTKLFEVAVAEGFVPALYDYREDRYVDQPTLPREQLFFVRRYFKTFVHLYRFIRSLPAPLARPLENAADRLFTSQKLPHEALVKLAVSRDRMIEQSKSAFRSRFPRLYLKVRDRVRGVAPG